MTSEADRLTLLSIARKAIIIGLQGKKISAINHLPPNTKAPTGSGGAFVTIKEKSTLRGCIGQLTSDRPIIDTIASMAYSAAFQDPRFPPLRSEEIDSINLEISRISEFFPIKPNDIQVGVHGLLLRLGNCSGLLLPQVPVEQKWDRLAFLDGICQKANLSHGSWEHPSAILEGFTAEVFGEC